MNPKKRSGFLPKRGRARVWTGRLKRRLHTVPLRLRKKGDVLTKINNDLRRYYLLRGLEKKRMKNETITRVGSTKITANQLEESSMMIALILDTLQLLQFISFNSLSLQ